jgi:non-homologous end joining protein Ku
MPTATTTFTRQSLGRTIRSVGFSLDDISFFAGLRGSVADQDPQLESLCAHNHPPSKIQRKDSCPVCGNDDKTTFSKGKVRRSEATVLDATKLAELQAANDEVKENVTITVVDADDELMFPIGSTYYIDPAGRSASKTYALLAAVIKKRPKLAFLAELSMGGQPKLYRLTVSDGVILMREIARPEALRAKPEIAGDVSAPGLRMMEQLVDAIKKPFDPVVWRNQYFEGVTDLLDQSTSVAAGEGAPAVDDILAQLQASVARRRQSTATAKPTKRKRPAASPATGTAEVAGLAAVPDIDAPTPPRRRTRKVA